MDRKEERLQTLKEILNWIRTAKENDKCLSKKKTVAEIQVRFGNTKRKSEEYLQALQDSNLIRIDGDEIWQTSQ